MLAERMLAERSILEPMPTEIRVRVVGASVNPVDVGNSEGGGLTDVIGAAPFVLGVGRLRSGRRHRSRRYTLCGR